MGAYNVQQASGLLLGTTIFAWVLSATVLAMLALLEEATVSVLLDTLAQLPTVMVFYLAVPLVARIFGAGKEMDCLASLLLVLETTYTVIRANMLLGHVGAPRAFTGTLCISMESQVVVSRVLLGLGLLPATPTFVMV